MLGANHGLLLYGEVSVIGSRAKLTWLVLNLLNVFFCDTLDVFIF